MTSLFGSSTIAQGHGPYSPARWMGIIAFVMAVHAAVLLGGWVRVSAVDDTAWVPMVTRMIEVVSAVPPLEQPQPDKKRIKSGPRDKPRDSPVLAPQTPPTEPVALAVPTPSLLAPAPAAPVDVWAQLMPKATGLPPINGDANMRPSAAVVASGQGGQGAESGDAEKVVLTVPKKVKVPASRSWSFVTVFKEGMLSSPNIPTEFRWKVDNGRYEAYLGAGALVSSFTKLSRSSAGVIGEKGLEPERFLAVARNGKQDASHFVRKDNQITFNNSPAQPMLPGAQDEISAALQLSTMLAGEPERYKVGDKMALQVARRTGAQIWVFTIEADEPVDLPNGSVKALRLVRAPREPNDTAVTLWLSPEHDYMLVRLRMDYSATRSDDVKWMGY